MARLPKYLYTFWFEELEDFSRTETIRLSNRNIRIWANPRQATQERTFLKENQSLIWPAETDRDGKLEMATAVIEDTLTPGSGLTYDDSTAVIFDLDGNGYNLYGELIEPATHTSLGCLENGKDLECPCFDGKETFTEGTGLLVKETPDPYGMGC